MRDAEWLKKQEQQRNRYQEASPHSDSFRIAETLLNFVPSAYSIDALRRQIFPSAGRLFIGNDGRMNKDRGF